MRKYIRTILSIHRSALLFTISIVTWGQAYASSTTGLPWESPLETIVQSLTGPWAFGISVIAILAASWGLLWGGEMGEWVRRMVMVVMAIAVLIGGANILSVLFGSSGTVIY